MGHALKQTQLLVRNLVPNAILAPNTRFKHVDNLYTKIKDPLAHNHTFDKVVAWNCECEDCPTRFAAVIKDRDMFEILNSVTRNPLSKYHTHYMNLHDRAPTYPLNIKTLSKKDESGITRLENRLLTELAADPNLINVASNPTSRLPDTITLAIKQVALDVGSVHRG